MTMFEVRFHGRGGQGVVSAAEMLSIAAFLRGKHAQAFPSFGSERMGAPVISFCRIDNKPIRSREPIVQPDAIVIQDPTLLHATNLLEDLKPGGYLVLNSVGDLQPLNLNTKLLPGHCCTVPATQLAMLHVGRAAPNTALLAAFVTLTGLLDLDVVFEAIRAKFPNEVAEKNIAAARAAHEFVLRSRIEGREAVVC
jgi:pyruvate ferredoxin oxidoreductase gamma subunit